MISKNEAQFKFFVISWKSQASFYRHSNLHIPSTWKVLTLQLVENDVECMFEYILNRKLFGHKICPTNRYSYGKKL